MKLFEMEGFLRGKCIPRDLKVNETNAEYLVRKFAEADAMCAALAAENTGMKAKGRELLGEACAVYAKFNKLIDPEIGDFIDGQTLHEFQYVLDCETPATDAFLAEVRAQGVEMFALMFAEEAIKTNNITTGWRARASRAASEYAEALREDAALLRKGVQS
ncbi:hypothetical protein P838_00013 [Enterobacter hormaechei]|uniref:hypothetical protein n=1 Tax=Enterobacter hormaechei TaxID=158836 RepID=UPI000448B570|nr:hypothetical protein [Enterobacter hormaechei]EUL61992.1 hypothetical protein P839_04081 [Enterobacter hormaechei]EUL62328.1 hypothetical protein P838_03657 [Enterobacter hormaechei]EUL63080.1 hypothetical protein P838_04416 [Enterobacter hormaechei]EUL63662.1 hypothetical protein P839_04076 [Enterobacter hormaechei]EUL66974.1 hypothetical protein P839_01495 [Enterobacter hormaechei]